MTPEEKEDAKNTLPAGLVVALGTQMAEYIAERNKLKQKLWDGFYSALYKMTFLFVLVHVMNDSEGLVKLTTIPLMIAFGVGVVWDYWEYINL